MQHLLLISCFKQTLHCISYCVSSFKYIPQYSVQCTCQSISQWGTDALQPPPYDVIIFFWLLEIFFLPFVLSIFWVVFFFLCGGSSSRSGFGCGFRDCSCCWWNRSNLRFTSCGWVQSRALALALALQSFLGKDQKVLLCSHIVPGKPRMSSSLCSAFDVSRQRLRSLSADI